MAQAPHSLRNLRAPALACGAVGCAPGGLLSGAQGTPAHLLCTAGSGLQQRSGFWPCDPPDVS